MQERMKNVAYMAKRAEIKDYNLTVPVVLLNCNAKNSQKYPNIFFKCWSHPLRWIISFATVFPRHQTTLCPYPNHSISTTQQPLFHQRFDTGHPLPNHPRIRTDRNQYSPATKWRLPISGEPSHLSQSDHPAKVSGALWLTRTDGLSASPRSIPKCFSDETRFPLLGDLRFRYQGFDRLRPAGRSQSRIQSKEARTSFLSTPSLLRRKNRRCLGRHLSLWRCASRSPQHRYSGEEPFQTSFRYPGHPCAGRLGLLRPCPGRVYCGGPWRLCDRCQDYQTDSETIGWSSIRRDLSWTLAHRIRIQTLEMENHSTLHRGETSHPRKTFLATLSLQDGGIYLPCDRNQSFLETSEPLAILQPESHRRTHHPRTSRRIYSGENPNQRLGFQPGLFPSGPLRLQLDQLVQTPLLTGRLATTQSSVHSKSVVLGARPIGSLSRKTGIESTEQLPILKNIYKDFKKH